MLEELKERVCRANKKLVEYGLAILTWGNVSAISDDRRYVVIKPSGVDYEKMRPEHMVVVDISGNTVEGELRPSSDLPTHLELYRSLPQIKSVVHTHSRYATAFAQAEKGITCYGTTQADYFHGKVPCTRRLSAAEIAGDYERSTGRVIVETVSGQNADAEAVPSVLVCRHGPFSWGSSIEKAVENAYVLEETAHMAALSQLLDKNISAAPQELQDKHFFRKHGESAYYGQTLEKL